MIFTTRGWLYGAIVTAAVAGGCNCKKTGGGGILKNEGTLAAKPTSLNFGNVPVNQKQTLNLILSNTGVGELNIDSQSITGDTTKSFSAATFKTAFAIGGSNSAKVTFEPTVGGPLTAQLVFDNDGSDSPFTVDMQGTGIDINVACTPTSLNFGPVQVGVQPAPTMSVTCTNNGQTSALLSVSAVDTDPQFNVTDMNGPVNPSTQQMLAANGGTYTVGVAFDPANTGNVTSSFTYTACATTALCAAPAPIALNGVGVSGALAIVPDPISYTGVPMGSQATQTITVTNVGSNSLTVSCLSLDSLSNGTAGTACGEASSLFSFSGLPSLSTTLAAGASFTFTLAYTASGGTTDGDQLDAFYQSSGSSATSEATDPITGNQTVNPCSLTITPATISFGTVTLGSTLTKAATLTNSGGATCNISGVALDATSDPSYSLDASQATSFTIPASGSATITVDFNLNNSSTPNSRKGLVDYASDDPNHLTGTIPLIAYLQTDSPYAGGWPKWHYDNNNSGHTSADTSSNNGTVLWKNGFELKGVSSGGIYGTGLTYINSPVVGDNTSAGTYTIYQVSLNGSGTLYAFNQDGSEAWGTNLSDPTGDPHPDTPIVTKNGTIYAVSGCDSQSFNNPSNLFYLTTAGAILSQQTYGADGFDACPGLANDGTFFECDDDGSSNASAMSTDMYSVISFQANSSGAVSVTAGRALNLTQESERFGLGIADDDSSFVGNNGQFFALTPPASGMTLVSGWPAAGVTQPGTATAINNGDEVYSDLAIDSTVTNSIFAYSAWEGYGNGNNISYNVGGVIQSLDIATGAVNWTVNLPSNNVSPGGLLSDFGNAAPAYDISTNQVYVGNSDGLRAIDMSTGTVNWTFKSADVTSSPAIGGDSTIFFGCEDGSFYAVNASDGSLKYKVVAAAPISSSPAIADDGIVYFVSDDGFLWAVQ